MRSDSTPPCRRSSPASGTKTPKTSSGRTMDKILTKKALAQWGKKLRDSRVFFPRPSEDGRWDYAEASEGDELILDVRQTAVPPKKILFPQREVFAEFSETVDGAAKTLEVKEALPEDESGGILGVRPCEGRAAWLLAGVFGGEFNHAYSWERGDPRRPARCAGA